MKKINWKAILIVVIWLLVISLLIYSRFVNLGWGLPYPMHPDERNMAIAVQNLNCSISNIKYQISNLKECFNPHFFAYGQLPLYLGYLLIGILKGFKNFGNLVINFEEAMMSLRVISTLASVINTIIIIKIINLITKKNSYFLSFIFFLLIMFSPYAIQFAHFGTTESFLMLFYSLIIYYCLLFTQKEIHNSKFIILSSLISGLVVATKVSSIIFIAVPIIAILSSLRSWDRYKNLIKFGLLTTIFIILFSPHNLINFHDFVSSIRYESDVALGKILVFYTRQFVNTVPILFQLTKVFPYALGWPVWILGGLGILGLGWKDRKINLLRFAFLVYFIPSAFLFAKWSRFMAPVLPLMTVFAIVFLLRIRVIKIIKIIIIILAILPGVAYLSVYQNSDVRFQASEWIYKNIPENAYILSETANVVDIPITSQKSKVKSQNYQVISFDFYDLDESPELQSELKEHLEKADYIFVPSRRIFANHPKKKYPMLNQYYNDLFNGKLGFIKVAEFSAGLNDEQAEETWTVFDHPVIRIYKKVKTF
ncbi:MAG: hypothetical protein AAB437_01045 [Patescibacteria group bacterium]